MLPVRISPCMMMVTSQRSMPQAFYRLCGWWNINSSSYIGTNLPWNYINRPQMKRYGNKLSERIYFVHEFERLTRIHYI